jgi:hypothetical protein
MREATSSRDLHWYTSPNLSQTAAEDQVRRKILFVANDGCDYLSDSVFHGLRSLFGADVVDFPKAERMYKSAPPGLIEGLRGHGFTLYGLLDDIEVDRPTILDPAVLKRDYDLIIMGDIWRQGPVYDRIHSALNETNAIMLDGADVVSLYKYAGFYWRHGEHRRWPGRQNIPYFKRELTPGTLVYRCYCLLPAWIAKKLLRFVPWKTTAFAVPREKITTEPPAKTKTMAAHIVDPEVAAHFGSPGTNYAFHTESGYYGDLKASRFAVTTMRGGWDCLRHYEIAANGCVPCFRDLDTKPKSCAPHGMNRGNCIVYTSLKDLLEQIDALDEDGYNMLREGALNWAYANSTEFRAAEILFASGHSDLLVPALAGKLLA